MHELENGIKRIKIDSITYNLTSGQAFVSVQAWNDVTKMTTPPEDSILLGEAVQNLSVELMVDLNDMVTADKAGFEKLIYSKLKVLPQFVGYTQPV